MPFVESYKKIEAILLIAIIHKDISINYTAQEF